MLAFETLTQAPKAATLATGSDAPEQANRISFEEFLKGVSKQALLLTPKGNVILPAQDKTDKTDVADDPKAMLLALLQNEKSDNTNEELPPLLQSNKSEESSKTGDLLALLKNDSAKEFTLNPALSKELSVNEVKYLLHKAKQYLKTRILQADPQLTQKELPKSLKGLLRLADKLKIEITKISFEMIVDTKKTSNPLLYKTTVSQNKRQMHKIMLNTQTDLAKLQQIKTIPLFQPKNQNIDVKHIMTTAQIIENKTKKEHIKKSETTDLLHSLLKSQTEHKNSEEPLFTNLQQILKKEPHNPLQTDKQNPKPEQKETNALEELLRGETTHHEDKIHTQKTADTLDVKIHEAKQMMRYLSQDIKRAIEEYKPPFSRVKVKLNPQRLGEMDLTVVQRGKNVHINLSSNNAALNILTNNLSELKTQLNQNGINNATFNFNSDAHNQQQQKEQQQGRKQYEYFANEEENEEQSRSLEIIVPRYI